VQAKSGVNWDSSAEGPRIEEPKPPKVKSQGMSGLGKEFSSSPSCLMGKVLGNRLCRKFKNLWSSNCVFCWTLKYSIYALQYFIWSHRFGPFPLYPVTPVGWF